jgi:3-amino-5-hydroxybenzoic acid synthesis related protein
MKAFFFDFDGVIIDSEPLMRYAFTESYKKYYGEESVCPVEEYLSHCGDSFTRIMQKLDLSPILFDKFKEVSRSNLHMIKIFPGIINVLKKFKERNFKIALITGKESSRTIEILKNFDMYHYFDLLVCSDMVKNPKPNPESIYKALDFFEINCNEGIMIGDSLYDIISAQRANVKTIAVLWGVLKDAKLFKEIGADNIIKEPKELLEIEL